MSKRRTMAKGRNEQLVRLLQILRDLDRLGGLDVYELAESHGTTTRTVRRDLAALEAAGFTLIAERDGARLRYRIDLTGKLAKLSSLLDASHYLALRVAMEPGAPMRNTSRVFADLEDLGTKIEAAIGAAGREQLARMPGGEELHEPFGADAGPAPEQALEVVRAQARRGRHRVEVRLLAGMRFEKADRPFDAGVVLVRHRVPPERQLTAAGRARQPDSCAMGRDATGFWLLKDPRRSFALRQAQGERASV